MKKFFPLVLIIVLSFGVVAAASSLELGVKTNTSLDVASFADFYVNDNFSLGASITGGTVEDVQTPSFSLKHVQISGRYHAPSVRSMLSFFGGAGLRLGINSQETNENEEESSLYSVLLFGMRLNSTFGLNLIGEFSLVSNVSDLSSYRLEPWFGVGFRF